MYNFSLGGRAGVSNSSSEDESVCNDNASVYSMRSENGGGSLEDDSEEIANLAMQREDTILQALENASEKSGQTRVKALQDLVNTFMHHYQPDFVEDRKITIIDVIEKSLRRGKNEEPVLAAQLVPLLVLQLGGSAVVKTALDQLLLTTALNKAIPAAVRAKCCSALGLLTFLGGDDIGDLITMMQHFETIFSGSYLKGNGGASAATANDSVLHVAALNAWGLLLTLIPSGDFCSIFKNNSFQP